MFIEKRLTIENSLVFLSFNASRRKQMMTVSKKLLSLFSFLILAVVAYAQPTGYVIEVDQVHYDSYDGVDLTGYATYKVYVEFTSPDDKISAIFGLLGADDNPDDDDLYMTSDCSCFQHPQGNNLPNAINPALCEIPGFEGLCLDTYWTINRENGTVPGTTTGAYTVVINTTDSSIDNAIDPTEFCSEIVDDGVIFTTNDQPNAIVGPSLRALVAQVTACGEVCMDFGIQYFPAGVISPSNAAFDPQCRQYPCDAEPIDETISVLENIDCFGNLATVEIGGGGNLEVEYQLWTADVDGNMVDSLSTQIDNTVFEDLTEGSYIISAIDGYGCRDTSLTFTFVEPTELLATMEQTGNNSCFGDSDAEICVDVTGGTGAYTIDLLDCDDNVIDNIDNNECFESITCVNDCGDFSARVVDENQCEVLEQFVIDCPSEITLDASTQAIFCADACTGSVTGTVEGGAGVLTFTYDPVIPGPAAAAAPVELNLVDLCPGDYEMTITDANGCTYIETFSLDNPPGMTVTYDIDDALCFADCNGLITPDVSGGTPDYTFLITDLDLTPVPNPNGLCAGEYIHTTLDANLCPVIDTLTIDEPDQILFEVSTTDISCFGETNGSICVENQIGGVGTIDYSLVPNSGVLVDDCFEGLGAQTFSLTVSDDNCTVTQNGIVISEPNEIVLTLTPTDITCFGDNDGSVLVEGTGGTGQLVLIDPVNQDAPATIIDLAPGTVTVTVQDENLCQAIASEEIIEPEVLAAAVLSTSNIGCGGDCDGSADILIEGGSGDYSITNNGEEINPFALCADVYTDVQVSDENGCIALVSFDIIQPDPIEILNTITSVTCTGMNDGTIDIFPIGGSGPITWTIDPEDLDLNNLFEGEYLVTAVDSIGCVADSILIMTAAIETDMTISLFSSPVTCWDEADGTATAAVSGGAEPISWLWNDDNSQNTSIAVGLPEEVYTVVVTDAIGCTLSDVIEVFPTEGCFFIATAITPNGDGANDTWTIGGLEYFPASTVQVFNRWGQIMFESKGYSTAWDGTLNGKELPVADYYFIISYDDTKDPITGTVTIKY